MKANAVSLLGIFEQKQRLEVPLFQRQYVWSRETQWEPLWEDISRKFDERLDGRVDAPVHFLGAMVLDQKQTPTTHVIKRQVIDGQQRLTTLQLFIAAFRDFANDNDCGDIAAECSVYTANKGMMAEPDVDQFKMWPTTSDRSQFSDIMLAGSRKELEKKHPLIKQKYARQYDPRPRMVEAYLYFYEEISDYFTESEEAPELASSLHDRLETCFHALKETLQVVVIDLDSNDDAQVIFETLNARGEPLLPADLLRNYIFLRAARLQEDQEELYNKYWLPFDDAFWRQEVRQGRLSRPRSDLFMQHFLASRQHIDIPIKHLYVEYRHWIEKYRPFETVEAELEVLKAQREHFRRLIVRKSGDPLTRLARFLELFDVSTVLPLILWFMSGDRSDEEIVELGIVLESYLVRRAVCGLTTKSYNRTFLRSLSSLAKHEPATVDSVRAYLKQLTGESSEWPNDVKFEMAWQNDDLYRRLSTPRLGYILTQLNSAHLVKGGEDVQIQSELTIEHLLPQSWINEWPLADGSKGMNYYERWDADKSDPRKQLSEFREVSLNTIGNLTIVTQPLNSALSNSAWTTKRPELLKVSLLPINQMLHEFDSWNEEAIEIRGARLFEKAVGLWPR